ncbi:thiol reductant ABC exporter subunit CydD [Kribbella sp. NPDC055071]
MPRDEVMNRIRRLPGVRRVLLTSTTIAVVSAVLIVAQANLLAITLAGIALGTSAKAPLLALGIIFALRAGLAWVRESTSRTAAARVKLGLRQRLFVAIQQLGPVRLHRERGGELATVAAGLDGLDDAVAGYLPRLAPAVVLPIAVLAMTAIADPLSAGVIAVTLPLIPIFGVLVGMHTRTAARGQWRALGELGGHFLDVVRGMPTLRVFGRVEHQVGVVRRTAENYRVATLRTLRIAFLSSLTLELVATISAALVAVPVGLRLLAGQLDLTTGLLVLFLAPEAYRPLRELGSAFHAAASGQAAAERAFAVIDQANDPPPTTASNAPPPPAVLPGGHDIRLHQATIGYPGGATPILRAVTLHIAAGEKVALVGPSGAGKSTLLAVLLGFLTPIEGTASVGGADLRDLDADGLARWRERVTWVPQRPHLFAGTIADNIALGAPSATPAQIRTAARSASAAEFVEALPGGYDAVLGDHGDGLSVGQRQRIALARAFLRDTPILLLDEPTAGIDAGNEAAVLDAIRTLANGRTLIVATHRRALLHEVDRVLAVVDGSVQELDHEVALRRTAVA